MIHMVGMREPAPPSMLLGPAIFIIIGLLTSMIFIVLYSDSEQYIQKKHPQTSAAENIKDGVVLPPCDEAWIWYRNKCFYFSEAEGTWTEAKDSCAALDSSLALIDNQLELDFMLRYKGNRDHWIGLERMDRHQPWIWVNGTEFNNWFTVEDSSECAYLSYVTVKSLESHSIQKWICTRMLKYEVKRAKKDQ